METDHGRAGRHAGYLAGATAVLVDDTWIVLTPTDVEPFDLAPELDGFGVVTSDNPYAQNAQTLSPQENTERRQRLRERFEEEYPQVHPTAGGTLRGEAGSWQDAEHGFAARMSREEAAMHGAEHDQEAVYVIEGDTRLLIFADGEETIEQHYRVTRYPRTETTT
jgi:hypothetical protein